MSRKSPTKSNAYHHGNLAEESVKWGLWFLEQGQSNFSMRELAKKVGVTHGALTRHFGAKCGLMAAIAEEGFKKFNDYLEASTQSGSLEEQFSEMARSYVRFSLDYPYHYKLMMGGKIPNHNEFEGMKEQGQRAFLQLVNLLEKMQDENVITKGDPLKRAYAVWSGIHGLVLLTLEGHIDVGCEVDLAPKEMIENTLDFSLEIANICSRTMINGFKVKDPA